MVLVKEKVWVWPAEVKGGMVTCPVVTGVKVLPPSVEPRMVKPAGSLVPGEVPSLALVTAMPLMVVEPAAGVMTKVSELLPPW